MHLRRLTATALIVMGCGTTLHAEESPIVTAQAVDIGRSIERFWQTPFGRLWHDPSLAQIKMLVDTQWAQGRQQAQAAIGLDPQAIVDALTSLRADLNQIDLQAQSVDFTAQVELGAVAEQVMGLTAGLPSAEVAGADQAVQLPNPQLPMVLARFGNVLMLGSQNAITGPKAIATSEEDLLADIDVEAYLDTVQQVMAMTGQNLPELPPQPKQHLDFRIIEPGFWERWSSDAIPYNANRPIDLELLRSLPASALLVMASGVDGAKLWDTLGPFLMNTLAMEQGLDAATLQAQIDGQLQAIGLNVTVDGLARNLQGTFAIAVTQAAPFPGLTVALPSSPEVDQIVGFALQMQLGQQPPAIGSSVQLQMPTPMPIQIQLGRSATNWVIGTDVMAVNALVKGTPGTWASTAPAQAALSVLDGDPEMICTSNTRDLINMALGYAPMLAISGQVPPEAEPYVQQATMALQQLATMVKGGYLVGGPQGSGYLIEAKGLMTPISTYAIAIPIAIGAAMDEFRGMLGGGMGNQKAGQAIIKTTLKAGVFPAQVQFQSGGYADIDGDGIGTYGFPQHMAGTPLPTSGQTLQLLDAKWNAEQPLPIDGWNVQIWLPNGPGTATAKAAQLSPTAEDLREQYWIAYAWPADASGDTMYAIDQNGQVYQADYWGLEPQWNELYDGQDWGSDASWQPSY